MKYTALLFTLLVSTAFAQQKKYQGLLWEVSGNGLQKNSYLYGSMHVSDKVSYHLSDAFFKHLLEADMVANESEPSTWMDLMDVMGGMASTYGYGSYKKLYAEFYLSPTKKEELLPLFRTRNFNLNNLLFRTNEYEKEYQEETYLDMFIYRTGKKYGKKTVGLEDARQSILNMMDMDYSDTKPKEENRLAMQRILKNTNYEEALMNYYREKDLDMLDSLTTLASGEGYLKALLYDRNEVFVKSIDSLVKKGSLFAAVGAAHLPGKKGLIELLRAKGYTVKPVPGSYTDEGREKKEMIESYFIKPELETYTTADGLLSLPIYKGAVIESGNDLQSPDLANGGYINVKRILLKDFLKKDNSRFNHKSLDSLFYENIPGKILDKKFYTKDGFDVYDIKSVTKTGNAQHYRYYITPLEVIMVSMAGERDYVKKFDDALFNNIHLKPVTENRETKAPKKGVYQINMPGYTAAYGETAKNYTAVNTGFFGYDPLNKADYFIIERTVGDTDDLEDTAFELKRMQYEFYRELDIDSSQTKLTAGNHESFTSSSKIGNKAIHLKSVIHGSEYFLLGTVGASDGNTEKFFNSFALKPAINAEDYRIYTDSAAHYSIKIPKKENEILDFQPKMLADGLMYGNRDKDLFREKYSNREFTLPSGQKINLNYHKEHRFHTAENIDTIWNTMTRYITETNDENRYVEDFNDIMESVELSTAYSSSNRTVSELWDKIINRKNQSIKLINDKKSYHKDGDYYTFEGTAVANNSSQALKFKMAYRNGETYVINTTVDKNDTENPVIDKVFNSLTLLGEPEEDKLPDDRLMLFIQDAHSEYDSIRTATLASVHQLVVSKKDIPALEKFIKDFDFKKEETEALTGLYSKLAETKDASVIPFLEQQYKKEGTNTIIQFAVLSALAETETEAAYQKIAELLEYDLPIPDRKYEVMGLFNTFEADTKHSAVLFPNVLQYYSIPEYQQPVVDFTATLLEEDAIKPKKLKSYKKMLLTNAKLEIKRAKSRMASRESGDYDYYGGNSGSDLAEYMELLYPFRNDKAVQAVFESVKSLDTDNLKLEMARLDIQHGNINNAEISALLQDPETLFKTQQLLAANKQNQYLKHIDDEQLAASAVISLGNINTKKDSLIFLKKELVPLDDKKITFFFYKIKHTGDEDDDSDYDYEYSGTDKLAAIAFLNDKDGHISPAVYKYAGAKQTLFDNELDDTIKTIIDATLYASKKRATFGKNSNGYDDMMDEYYDDQY